MLIRTGVHENASHGIPLTRLDSAGDTELTKSWIEKYHDKAEAAGVAVCCSRQHLSLPVPRKLTFF